MITSSRLQNLGIVLGLVCSLLTFVPTPAKAAALTCAQGGVCVIGDTGPGGGKVFYVAAGTFTQTGATGAMCSTYCKYLEAAPTTGTANWTDIDYAWSGNTNTLIGSSAQGTAIGTGYRNTLAIVGQSSGGSTSGKAGTVSRAYLGPNNKTDWFLPSNDELHQLRLQKTVVSANVAHSNYWSSTEIDASQARYLYFLNDALFSTQHSKSLASGIAVRPIRAFGSAPYDGTNGVVSCGTSGTFTILNNAVSASTSCVGSVTIPEGVTAADNNVFYGVSGVTSVSLPSTLLTIGSSAFRTTSISTILIPTSVTTIGALAFSINAVPVTSLTFTSPSSLTTIGDYAFQYSDFASITIPASVTNMGTDVFNANGVLTTIYFLGNKPGGSTLDIFRNTEITVFKTSAATGFGSTWNGATVASPPAAPTSLSATAGDAQISIAFTAGSNNGSGITNYKYSLDGTTYTALSPSDTATPVVIPGLANGTSYTIRLKAVNAAGDSVASSSVTATPTSPSSVVSVAAIGGVTTPVRGATPVTTVTAANGYTGTVTWSGSPTTFVAATAYTATINLTATAGFTLTGVAANFFTVAGATSVTHSANSGTITAVFPATTAIEATPSPTPSTTPAPPPPSFLKVKTSPTISLSADIYTCTAGTLIFWRYSSTEEASKLSYQKISLLRDGTEVASSVILKPTATFEKSPAWTGSTMTCQIYAAQENTVGTFSSFGADRYNELSKMKSASIKAANSKYFTDRTSVYDIRRAELLRISNEKASDLKIAKTSAQIKAASEKYRLAMTRISDNWKAEIKAAPARRDSSIALAQATFIQELAKYGLAITAP